MARFYGSVKGGRGETSRLGTVNSGIRAEITGWDIGIRIIGFVKDDKDHFVVEINGGSNNPYRKYETVEYSLDQLEIQEALEQD